MSSVNLNLPDGVSVVDDQTSVWFGWESRRLKQLTPAQRSVELTGLNPA